MKIAFLVQSHQYNSHFDRLCERLREFPKHEIFVHHDFSQSTLPVESIVRYRLNLVRPYRTTTWSSISQTQAEIDLIETAYRNAADADWFILLSASCYPIKSWDVIVQTLQNSAFDGYIDLQQCNPDEGELHRHWHRKMFTMPIGSIPFVSRNGKFYQRELRIPRTETPFHQKFKFFFGANWFILSRKVVEYLVNLSLHSHPIVKFYMEVKGVAASDEVLINSVLGNANQFNLSPDYLRYIDWTNSVNWHPNTLTEAHFQSIAESNALFARKFDAVTSQTLLEKIDQELLHVRTIDMEALKASFIDLPTAGLSMEGSSLYSTQLELF
jgi:hypothetical protein